MTDSLPEPDSEEIAALVGSATQRLFYGLLYRRRDNPTTMTELRFFVANALGEEQSQADHCVRELRRYFEIEEAASVDGESRYILRNWSPTRPSGAGADISLRRRAEVLAPQPLCEDCDAGKRDYFRSFAAHAEEIRTAIGYDEPQKRVGELLKAFGGEWVRSDLLGIVASAGNFQEDWQRRLRDLRFLGWDYRHQKRYDEGARVWTYYSLTRSAPWPENIAQAIRDESARRKTRKTQSSAGLDEE